MANRAEEEGSSLIFTLAYCSRVSQILDSAEIDALISAARLKNAREEITGWLVCGSGIFFQWLEGSREAVKRLMDSINADTRHNTIVILSESEEVRERLFGDWDMELVSPDHIREVLIDAMSEAKDAQNLRALGTLLKEVDSRGLKQGLMNLIDF